MTDIKTLRLFQVDAFIRPAQRIANSGVIFSGNPAAVVPLEQWLPDQLMQAIAAENNLSETAFFTGSDGHYHIRWFTPETEVDLCGHATLASAWVIAQQLQDQNSEYRFTTESAGDLSVVVSGEPSDPLLELNFPQRVPETLDDAQLKKELSIALGQNVVALSSSRDLVVELENAEAVIGCIPDMHRIAELTSKWFAVIITARYETPEYDFVSRFFAPLQGIAEDPVTGSSFCSLAPYWAEKLSISQLKAWQCSARGDDAELEIHDDRVKIRGRCFSYLSGNINLPAS